jgi:hypothetical protein
MLQFIYFKKEPCLLKIDHGWFLPRSAGNSEFLKIKIFLKIHAARKMDAGADNKPRICFTYSRYSCNGEYWVHVGINSYKLILHVGTNSLKSRETSTKHAEEIISLAESVKNTLPETELIIISGLITRVDNGDLENKVNQVNKVLKEMCFERHWKFIGHPNITSNHLNRSGIRLNEMGTAIYAISQF